MNGKVVEKRRGNNRMQSIECFRLIASMLVVFIHCKGSGRFGIVMDCLARVAVPFFFVVSGYFSYGTCEKTIRKRLWSVVKMAFAANFLYLLWSGFRGGIKDFGGLMALCADRCSSRMLVEVLLLNRGLFSEHLWYMNAIIPCYAVMWLYTRWAEGETCNYKQLYITSIFLYAVHVVLSSFVTACGLDDLYRLYRNALFFGFPMFSLGIFLHEYHDRIIKALHLTKSRLMAVIAAGALLSILQFKGIGKVEMPIGALVEVIALMLLFVKVPTVSGNSAIISGIILTFGTLSTYIYITHILWQDIYNRYIKDYVLRLGEAKEAIIYPIAILGITLVTGVLYLGLKAAWKSLLGKIKQAGSKNK